MEVEGFDFNTGRRISIELGTQLQINIAGVDFKLKSTLIGIKPDKYLIIEAPLTSPYGNIGHKFFQGNKIIVRYLYKGTVFGFQSELIEEMYVPLRLLFIKYPVIIEEHNLRVQKRIDCFLPIKIKFKDKIKEGIILDISEGGCCCVSKKAATDKELISVQIDEEVTLKCQFPGIEGEQAISGKVKTIKRDKQQMTLGVMFSEIDPKIKDAIAQYVLAIRKMTNL
ncbi:MAG: hypothetical protein GWP10_05010 [Nitrospiraceae bacterium]|nr:hypothetical protein [Nitrospiraceae bacterium]